MGVKRLTCIELTCDGDCMGQGWPEDTPHFDSEQAAIVYLMGEDNLGWTRRPDGRLLCRGCSEAADCEATEHRPGKWFTHPKDPEIQLRWCAHCGGNYEQRLTAMAAGDGEQG